MHDHQNGNHSGIAIALQGDQKETQFPWYKCFLWETVTKQDLEMNLVNQT